MAATESFRLALNNPVRPDGMNLIFYGEPGRDGKRRPYNFNKVWADVKKGAGVGDFKFHDLRHEAVSRLVEAGLSDQEVASIIGQSRCRCLDAIRTSELKIWLPGLMASRRCDSLRMATLEALMTQMGGDHNKEKSIYDRLMICGWAWADGVVDSTKYALCNTASRSTGRCQKKKRPCNAEPVF
jgi:hypothetical protein